MLSSTIASCFVPDALGHRGSSIGFRLRFEGLVILAMLFGVGPKFPAAQPIAAEARNVSVPDGVLAWHAFLGGAGADSAEAVALDGSGNIFVLGTSTAAWSCSPFPCTVRDFTVGNSDAYVAKLNSAGQLVWNTFLGGSAAESVGGIALDANGNVYAIGSSGSSWGSPVRPFQTEGAIKLDAFVAKLEPDGDLVWNTFLGGFNLDYGAGLTVDDNAYVYALGTGWSWGCSPDPCTVRPPDGVEDAFVAQLDSSGVLVWNTFLGGTNSASGLGIAHDADGNLLAAGWSYVAWTCSATVDCTVRHFSNGQDGWIAKLQSSGPLIWNTFIGGSSDDRLSSITLDSSGNSYVAGYSNATWGSPIRAFAGGSEALVAKVSSSGSLTWHTFLGGNSLDVAEGIALDPFGNIDVVGYSYAGWGSQLRPFNQFGDAFAARLDSSGALHPIAFVQAQGDFTDTGVATDSAGHADVVTMNDYAWGTPTRAYTAGYDGLAAVLDLLPQVLAITRSDPNPSGAETVGFEVSFSEPVSGVDTTDFALTVTGATGASVAGVSGSGAQWNVTVDTGSGDGTLRLDLADDDTIVDGALMPLGGPGNGNGDFTSGETYTLLHPVISGNAGVAEATLSYYDGSDKTAVADTNGDFSLIIPYGWSGTVTPSKAGYAFTPLSRIYDNVVQDHSGQDFETAFLFMIFPSSGETVCPLPTVGVNLPLSDLIRDFRGAFDPTTVHLMLDDVDVTMSAKIIQAGSSPAVRAVLLYTPPFALAAGAHTAAFSIPLELGPGVRYLHTDVWTFTVDEAALCGSGTDAILPLPPPAVVHPYNPKTPNVPAGH